LLFRNAHRKTLFVDMNPNSKLRTLSPRQLNLVMETVNTRIENVSAFEEPEQG
jgi:hypothetical protein